jgi:murein L,D-transpeptidase YcbB/YkuD
MHFAIKERVVSPSPSIVFPLPLFRALVLTVGLLAVAEAGAVPQADTIAGEIQKRLSGVGETVRIAGDALDASALRAFYQRRNWHAAWSDHVDTVLSVLGGADQEGIAKQPLHVAAIAGHRAASGPTAAADEDLLITDALLRYAAALRGQRVNPSEIEEDWFLPTPSFDSVGFLESPGQDLAAAFQALEPPYAGYRQLRGKLADLKAVAASGDWPKVPTGPPIKPGVTDERIPAVRKRLMATAELAAGDAESTVYDEPLQAAVQLFQRRHGLVDDAVLGRQTVATMNVSAADRARQVALNMERWRWLPRRLEDNHIVVNVPGAWLEVVEDGKAVLTMRVIVGDTDHPTPALHARMTSLVLNPVWRVPASIATEEILPKLQKDPGYLIANDLELVSDAFPPGSPESQGVGISWKDRSTMPWPVRQRAGSDNALGRIKFNIPNNDDIYLHDTPNHRLFTRAFRALSHGCVRVEKPDALALLLLRDKDWSQEKLTKEIDRGETRTVVLGKSLPVWLLYWTMWVDADGVLQIRDDLYGRDERLAVALAHPAAAVPVSSGTVGKPKVVHCEGCREP